jgi:hypothetical protein
VDDGSLEVDDGSLEVDDLASSACISVFMLEYFMSLVYETFCIFCFFLCHFLPDSQALASMAEVSGASLCAHLATILPCMLTIERAGSYEVWFLCLFS